MTIDELNADELDFLAAIRHLRTLRDDVHGRAVILEFTDTIRAMPGDPGCNAAFAEVMRHYLLAEKMSVM